MRQLVREIDLEITNNLNVARPVPRLSRTFKDNYFSLISLLEMRQRKLPRTPPCLSLPTSLLKSEENCLPCRTPLLLLFLFPIIFFPLFGIAYGHRDVVTKH